MQNIVGLKVTAVRGIMSSDDKRGHIYPRFILFGDMETYIELEEQDYYDFHDCSSSARDIIIKKNKKMWWTIFKDTKLYPDSNVDI
jgi:hypothetical protein